MPNTAQPANEAELKEELEFHGRKLVALLYDSNLPEDIKEAIIYILPHMSLEQIDRLLLILETAYEDQETKNIDLKYQKNIEFIAKDFDQTEEALAKKFNHDLAELEKKIPVII